MTAKAKTAAPKAAAPKAEEKVANPAAETVKKVQAAATENLTKIREVANENYKKAETSIKDTVAGLNDQLANVREYGSEAGELVKTSGKTAAKGIWDFDVELFNFAKATMTRNVELVKASATAKNVQDLVNIQTNCWFGRLEESNKYVKSLADISYKTVVDTSKPLTDAAVKVASKKSEAAA
ncbi:MAG: phasin family protein [Rhodospirillales bacterium]|nr:phasin family protein [Rhodospirillales bacterium]